MLNTPLMKLVHLVYFMQTIFQMFIISKIHQGQIFIHIPVYLINFGRAVNDPQYDAETGDYANGHRLVSSPITAVEDRKYHTANTAYHQEDIKNYPVNEFGTDSEDTRSNV
ncbi:hypothetical protein SDC9_147696 [bioreactor metagenome]|uniref:Uncharacterized protein n=1 Tax=bioreactor metagenome TaxID=1076179 RepID=A0A645EF34_9ZZZZ